MSLPWSLRLPLKWTLTESLGLNIKEVSLVGEIRAYGGSRKTGAGVVRFTQEKGAASSFHRVIGEMVRVFSEKGIILPDE